MNRAYSVLQVKSVDNEQRVISGIATTPAPDRVGDIVEPLGVKFTNPMPLLWQHDSTRPVGMATFGKPTKDGIPFEAQLASPTQSANLMASVAEAWEAVTLKLVKGVSIGFRPIEYSFMDDGGVRFVESEVLELSLVTIPANADATIQSIKSIDGPLLKRAGKQQKDTDRPKKAASDWHVCAARDLPIDTSTSWDGPAAAKRILDDAGFDGDSPNYDKAQRGFLVCDSSAPKLRGSYKLPFADIVGGTLKAIEGGLHAAASRLPQTDIPQSVQDSAKAVLDDYIGRLKDGSKSAAAPGRKVNPPAPGKKTHPVKAKEAITMKKTYAEQITSFEATRQAKAAEMDGIMEKSIETGETLDAEAKEKYDTLETELKEIDEHLIRLRAAEERNKKAATAVVGATAKDGSESRDAVTRVQVNHRKLEKGIGFTRFVMATALAKGNPMQALEIFKGRPQWVAETPDVLEVLKTAVTAGSTSDSAWAGPLVNYTILTDEFIEFLRPLTIVGRMNGLTRVPFKVKIGRQTGGASVGWVGEGAPKPLTSLSFDSVTLDIAKIAGIIVLNQELMRLSSPSAELLVRNDLGKAIVQFMDSSFVDPSRAAVAGVSPASITNGVTGQIASGTTGAALRSDMKTLLSGFLTANMQVTDVVVLMAQHVALGISLMNNSLGQKEFPGLTMNGGDLMGLPVITSENIPSTGGSPTDGDPIIVVSQPDILLADDGQVSIDASTEASLQMDSAPDSPATASTTFISLWQQNQVGLRAERYVNWAKRRSTAVAYIQNAKYFE